MFSKEKAGAEAETDVMTKPIISRRFSEITVCYISPEQEKLTVRVLSFIQLMTEQSTVLVKLRVTGAELVYPGHTTTWSPRLRKVVGSKPPSPLPCSHQETLNIRINNVGAPV